MTRQVAAVGVAKMTWVEFVRCFDLEFAPPIKVPRLVREFQELQQTTETMVEVTRQASGTSTVDPVVCCR